ncbi:hypothetical protein CGRA01v4_06167 [Colletotrichum graminicola]|nr:hypothetical protein CGRA01v4_06167 [Colletotrichum graminicola]
MFPVGRCGFYQCAPNFIAQQEKDVDCWRVIVIPVRDMVCARACMRKGFISVVVKRMGLRRRCPPPLLRPLDSRRMQCVWADVDRGRWGLLGGRTKDLFGAAGLVEGWMAGFWTVKLFDS